MNITSKASLIIIFSLTLLFSFAQLSFAQQLSVGVYPPIFQIDITPPETLKSPFTIRNFSAVPIVLEISIKPFTSATTNNGEIKYISTKEMSGTDPSILQRVQVLDNNQPVDQITIAPNDQKDLTLSLDIPKQEPPSDYYFSIIFISKYQQTNQTTGSATNAGIATNVLLSIGPKDKTTGSLKEFSSPFFLVGGPVPFTISIQNSSKHFIVPQGVILIKNMFGQNVGNITLLPVNILSDTERFIPDSKFISQNEAVWTEKFLLGYYSAELTVALSTDGPLYKRKIHFIAIPYGVIIGFIISCIILTFIFIRVKKNIQH